MTRVKVSEKHMARMPAILERLFCNSFRSTLRSFRQIEWNIFFLFQDYLICESCMNCVYLSEFVCDTINTLAFFMNICVKKYIDLMTRIYSAVRTRLVFERVCIP